MQHLPPSGASRQPGGDHRLGCGAGRLVLGIGAGWHEGEHEAYGIPLPSPSERLDMLEESCQVLRGLASERRTTFAGRHYVLADAPMSPKLDLTLLVGGAGEQRTLRIAARYADAWNYWAFDAFEHKLGVLDQRCEEIGRDPASIRRSTQALLFLESTPADGVFFPSLAGSAPQLQDALGRLAQLGVDEFIVPDFAMPPAGPARWDLLDRLDAEVVSGFR